MAWRVLPPCRMSATNNIANYIANMRSVFWWQRRRVGVEVRPGVCGCEQVRLDEGLLVRKLQRVLQSGDSARVVLRSEAMHS